MYKRQYQKQVTTLRGIMRDFVVQIDSLNRRNQELLAENLEVKEQYKRVETEKREISEERDRLEPVSYTHLDVYKRQG